MQDLDHEVAHWRTDEGAVDCHFRDTRVEVVAVAAAVLGDPACEQFLQAGEGAACEHFGAEGVLLEGCDVGLVVLAGRLHWEEGS